MSGEKRPQLRVVGGNEALVRSARVSREARWPPLRVVGPADAEDVVIPSQSRSAPRVQSAPKRPAKRPAWSQVLMTGLVLVMLSSFGQAIAHW
jgi:hypothetical protein